MKKVAVIQDLSSFGKCSLTAAIPVLSVMGIQACPLPTAILTAQTEFPSYHCEDLTANIPVFETEWRKLQATFDGIHTGYITGTEQIAHIMHFLDAFYKEDTILLVDPVMGNTHGAFTNFNEDFLAHMKQLVKQADIITPNLTEYCLLTGLSYKSLMQCTNESDFLQTIAEASEQLEMKKEAHILITSIHSPFATNDGRDIGNMYIHQGQTSYSTVPFNGRSYSGTGDLFASVIIGSIMRGESIPASIKLAEAFLQAAIEDTHAAGTPSVEGVHFENHLKLLL
ncbi:pyridoxamine kinase [Sporosarcina sp. Sa2YVA2]|uniref:Pyridoxamine kinase n=1 Tax=Sporosarcina quadrami TaxID=2762234 RepID=A0ABR8UDW5_9BACL|nr:pyridoxamine kinase [Sporosarcina quadrami]MBD7986227.1 pyridoxamine kinase [Sporosarcina quadrami]